MSSRSDSALDKRSTSTKSGAFDRIHWAQAAQTDSTSKHILSMMAIHADAETGYCYVKQSTLATETGYQRQTVSVHIQQLRDEGWIDIREQTSSTGYRRNHEYLLLFRDDVAWPDGSAPRVSENDTGKANPRVRDGDTPCHPDGHGRVSDDDIPVSAKRTRRVSEPDNINKPLNKPRRNMPKKQANQHRGGDGPESVLEVFVDNLGDLGICKPQFRDRDLSKQEWQDTFSALVDEHGYETVSEAVEKLTGYLESPSQWKQSKVDWRDILGYRNTAQMFARYFDDALGLTQKASGLKPGASGVLHEPAAYRNMREAAHV